MLDIMNYLTYIGELMWGTAIYLTYIITVLFAMVQILYGLNLLINFKLPAPAKSNPDEESIGYQIPISFIALIALGDIMLLILICGSI